MTPVSIVQGTGPIVFGLPHTGTYVPEEIADKLNENGRKLADTDWHIDKLYNGVLADATTVTANFHRYVIDANRDPQGGSLYPGQNTTTLVPLTDFDGVDIWETPPTNAEIEDRRRKFHASYHAALRDELTRVKAIHGIAILYDCHSIRSKIPYLFEGTLPDFNIGTNLGSTCDRAIETATYGLCRAEESYTTVLNGRFKGGWTTRHYGKPDTGIHAIQMELAQSTYLTSESQPWTYDDIKATRLRRPLSRLLGKLAHIALNGDLT
ncbi:N-formylglutamate deformylase [uncultured Sulfitobacter sp.]|uniref:N-formylglutamate deformylase n=1 Tax=uncultured Sulfitobacter sp. TaxID=191468 RepID=UPI00261CD47A|nr:N-formylglutamate deformylase [uncultured Sulfitobacter sp.]